MQAIKFETKQESFERFNNSMSVINKYDRSIGQDIGLVNHIGSNEYSQEWFLAIVQVQNSDKFRYADLKMYMLNSSVKVEYHWTKTLSFALNFTAYSKRGGGRLLHSSMSTARALS